MNIVILRRVNLLFANLSTFGSFDFRDFAASVFHEQTPDSFGSRGFRRFCFVSHIHLPCQSWASVVPPHIVTRDSMSALASMIFIGICTRSCPCRWIEYPRLLLCFCPGIQTSSPQEVALEPLHQAMFFSNLIHVMFYMQHHWRDQETALGDYSLWCIHQFPRLF